MIFLKIKSVFNPLRRLNELDVIPEIKEGYTDYWKAAELLCKKDGGHLATMQELAEIESYIYDTDIKPFEETCDLEVSFKRLIEVFNTDIMPIHFWSGDADDCRYAYSHGLYPACVIVYNSNRGNSYIQAVCFEN